MSTGLIYSLLLTCLAWGSQSLAAPTPFTCDNTAFVSQGSPTTLATVNTNVTPYTFTNIPLIPLGVHTFNAIAFNPQDGFIYAWTEDEHLLKIGSNGEIQDFGLIAGQSYMPSKDYEAGAFDKDGNYYFKNNLDNGNFNMLNISGAAPNGSVQSVSINPTLTTLSDFAYSLFDNKLYGMKAGTNELGVLDPATGNVVVKSTSGLPNQDYGSAWIDGLNRLFLSNSSTGDVYRIDDITAVTPSAILVSAGPASAENDGTSCGCVPILTKTVNLDTTFTGQTITYTYMIGVSTDSTMVMDFLDDLRFVPDFSGTAGLDESLYPINGTYIPGSFSMTGATGTPVFSNMSQTMMIDSLVIHGPITAVISIDVLTAFPGSTDNFYNQAVISEIDSPVVLAPFPDSILSDDPNSPFYPYPTGVFTQTFLPLEMLSFTGTEEDCQALLEWVVASESDLSHYQVLTSHDGISFNLQTQVEATGNPGITMTYYLVDPDLQRDKYYRLVSIGMDGEPHGSETILVRSSCAFNPILLVYPNPTTSDALTVEFLGEDEAWVDLMILDVAGKTVIRQSVECQIGQNSVEMDIGRLSEGIYHVRMIGSVFSGNSVERFLKMR